MLHTSKHVLSLGAGVQSSVLLLMSCRGELPKLDAAIFSDTGWEPGEVYTHLEWLKSEAARANIPLVTVSAGNIKQDALVSQVRGRVDGDGNRWASMPLRVLGPNGEQGMIKRQCTKEYKVEPIERHIKTKVLGLKPRGRWPKQLAVRQWMGITTDEIGRARTCESKWREFCYPFLGMPDWLGRTYNRTACVAWLRNHYPEHYVPRSACVGCPFRTNREWRWLRDKHPAEWTDACETDEALRKCGGMRGDTFLHRSYTPLRTADLDAGNQDTVLGTWDEECLGYCGV